MASMIGLTGIGLQLVPANVSLAGVGVNLVSTGVNLPATGVSVRPGGGPAPPTAFSGLLRFHSVAAVTGVANGASIASVPDLSPANDPAVQATPASQPIYSTTAANGKPGIMLDGANFSLGFTEVSTVQTAIVVASLADPQPENFAAFLGDSSAFDLTGPANTLPWLIDTTTVSAAKFLGPSRMNGIKAGALAIMSKPKSLAVTTIRMPAGQTMQLNNIAFDRVGNRLVKGVYAEVALFNRILSDAEVSSIEQFFCNRYSIGFGSKPSYGARANGVFIGDSITAGLGSTSPYPPQLATALGGSTKLAVSNVGATGSQASDWVSTFLNEFVFVGAGGTPWPLTNFAMTNTFHVCLGTNDLFDGQTAAATYASLQSLWATLRALNAGPVIAYTQMSRSDTGTPANFNASRATLNGLIPGNPSLYDFLVDLAADPTMGPNGAETNTTFFQTDLVHPTAAGDTIIANLSAAAYTALGL